MLVKRDIISRQRSIFIYYGVDDMQGFVLDYQMKYDRIIPINRKLKGTVK